MKTFIFPVFLLPLAIALLAPTKTRTLRLALDSEPRSLDPRHAADTSSLYLMDLVHCSLLNFDENGQITSSLADSWEWLDPTTLKVRLKSGVKFSDGTSVTSADVKATYQSLETKIQRIDSSGSDVTFKLREPDSGFLQYLSIGILPKATASAPKQSLHSTPIGCGPFQFSEVRKAHYALSRNPHYVLSKIGNLNRIEISVLRDEHIRLAKLRSGEIHLLQNSLSRDHLADLSRSAPQLKIYKRPALSVTYLGFNMRDPILSKPLVREAIAAAIDRDEMIRYIFHGMAIPARTLLSPEHPLFNPQIAEIKFDPAKAKQLLDTAGLRDPDGDGNTARFEITYRTTTDATNVTVGQAIATQLARIGVRVKIQALDAAKFKADTDRGLVQTWGLQWLGFKEPDVYRLAFATENFPPHGANRGWYSNHEIDAMLLRARTTLDPALRKQLYFKIQQTIADEKPYIFLWHEQNFAVVNSKISGFSLYADGRLSSLVQANL